MKRIIAADTVRNTIDKVVMSNTAFNGYGMYPKMRYNAEGTFLCLWTSLHNLDLSNIQDDFIRHKFRIMSINANRARPRPSFFCEHKNHVGPKRGEAFATVGIWGLLIKANFWANVSVVFCDKNGAVQSTTSDYQEAILRFHVKNEICIRF